MDLRSGMAGRGIRDRENRFMRGLSRLCTVLLFLYIRSAHTQALTVDKPNALHCDSLTTPIGDDTKRPSFSWKLQDSRFGAKQTAYRILVATARETLNKFSDIHWC